MGNRFTLVGERRERFVDLGGYGIAGNAEIVVVGFHISHDFLGCGGVFCQIITNFVVGTNGAFLFFGHFAHESDGELANFSSFLQRFDGGVTDLQRLLVNLGSSVLVEDRGEGGLEVVDGAVRGFHDRTEGKGGGAQTFFKHIHLEETSQRASKQVEHALDAGEDGGFLALDSHHGATVSLFAVGLFDQVLHVLVFALVDEFAGGGEDVVFVNAVLELVFQFVVEVHAVDQFVAVGFECLTDLFEAIAQGLGFAEEAVDATHPGRQVLLHPVTEPIVIVVDEIEVEPGVNDLGEFFGGSFQRIVEIEARSIVESLVEE